MYIIEIAQVGLGNAETKYSHRNIDTNILIPVHMKKKLCVYSRKQNIRNNNILQASKTMQLTMNIEAVVSEKIKQIRIKQF